MTDHSCTHQGHVWLETDGTPYTRTRGRSQASVTVSCKHCSATATLPRHSAFSGPRPAGMPIDTAIPPSFQKVLDVALTATPGSVPKQP
jgi:hypothetical protein